MYAKDVGGELRREMYVCNNMYEKNVCEKVGVGCIRVPLFSF